MQKFARLTGLRRPRTLPARKRGAQARANLHKRGRRIWRTFAGVLLGVSGLIALTVPAFATDYAIPPGQDAIIAKLLGEGVALPYCRLENAAIEQTLVRALFSCKHEQQLAVELRHPSQNRGTFATTQKFALFGKPADLKLELAAVAARIRENEADFQWIELQPVALSHHDTPVEMDAPRELAAVDDPKTAGTFELARQLHRLGKYDQALAIFVGLAHTKPQGVLGHIVASLASSGITAERAQDLRDDADLQRNDAIAQFVAGVAAHYAAHNNAVAENGKPDLYRAAIRYLERAAPWLNTEPRVHIYLAVSHFRLGEQKEAEAAIERAVALGADFDPDAYYCRAEIFQNADISRSIADLDRYIALTDPKVNLGDPPSPSKQARVKRMREHLLLVQQQKVSKTELFDPGSLLYPLLIAPRTFGLIVLGIGALTWLGIFACRRWRT